MQRLIDLKPWVPAALIAPNGTPYFTHDPQAAVIATETMVAILRVYILSKGN